MRNGEEDLVSPSNCSESRLCFSCRARADGLSSVRIALDSLFVVSVILDFLVLLTCRKDLRKSLLFFWAAPSGFSVAAACVFSLHSRPMMSHSNSQWRRQSFPPPPSSSSYSSSTSSSSSLYLHLHFPLSFLHVMTHTNHFICELLDFPDAARLQPRCCADPAFYFAHTEQISGIKWPSAVG